MIKEIILAIVQGITEFLPVSSSGHLALLQNYFGEVNLSLDIILHFATLLSILVYFRKDIISILQDFLTLKTKSENFKLAIFIIIATIPAGIAGFFFREIIEKTFSNLGLIALGFVISGMFLFTASLKKGDKPLNIKNTFIIGLAQALALTPGISRSGSTVSAGMLLGIKREKAIRFSFLLAIPAIIGATILGADNLIFNYSLIIPFALCFLVGLGSIHIFLKQIKTSNFKILAYYCWILALIIFLFYFF